MALARKRDHQHPRRTRDDRRRADLRFAARRPKLVADGPGHVNLWRRHDACEIGPDLPRLIADEHRRAVADDAAQDG